MPDEQDCPFTFLFTDVEGSTRLWAEHPEAMRRALARHDAILRAAIEADGGVVFKTWGDAFCAVFPAGGGAGAAGVLAAALGAQLALADEDWAALGDGFPALRVRMALHRGPAQARDGDYFGTTVNRVARLLSAGHGGQTLLTAAVAEAGAQGLPAGASLLDLGLRRLKDLAEPVRVFQLVSDRLPAEFPPLRTLDLRAHNLPVRRTSFVGREREVAAALAILAEPDVRLLTLTGPGGAGKTRLALQVAAELVETFEDGVYFVDLSPLRDPNLVVPTIARVLGVEEQPQRPLGESLARFLADRRLLLVLDNFEQVVEGAPAMATLLDAAQRLTVLATSRVRLALYGERELPVAPLPLPEVTAQLDPTAAGSNEAVRLFTDRARSVRPDFELSADNVGHVVALCRRLDGLPLAIELAASRTRILRPAEIVERLEARLPLLTGGPRDLPSRQRTIRDTITWSYELLTSEQRRLFRRLGVFAGGWTLDAAEAVAGDDGEDVPGNLESLVDSSLVTWQQDTTYGTRFEMLELIREYAVELLDQSAEAGEIGRRHAEHFTHVTEEADRRRDALWYPRTREPHLTLDDLERLEREQANFRAAMRWCAGRRDGADLLVRLAGTLLSANWPVFVTKGIGRRERRAWLADAISRFDDGQSAGRRAYVLYGNLEFSADPVAELDRALALFEEAGDSRGMAWCHQALAGAAFHDTEAARAHLEAALRLRSHVRNPWDMAIHFVHVGEFARSLGDLSAAAEHYAEAIEVQRAGAESGWALPGGPIAPGLPEANLGYVTIRMGDTDRAATLFATALRLCPEPVYAQLEALAGAVAVAVAREEWTRAARLAGAVEANLERELIRLEDLDRRELDQDTAAARAMLPGAEWRDAYAAGAAMRYDDAVAYALEGLETSTA